MPAGLAPDLAVEVVSPRDLARTVEARVTDFLNAGTPLVWVVYPEDESVYVYTSRRSVRVVDRAEELGGGTVLPGFRLPLADLFEDGAAQPATGVP